MSEVCCELCGHPMPSGEEMFRFHGYSGPCPWPPMPITADEITKATGIRFVGFGKHLARDGEIEYAVIKRNRSGQDADEIDYSFHPVALLMLSPLEQREMIDTARQMAESIDRALRDTAAP